MPDRDPPPLSDSSYDGFAGPAGFTQLDGGYPVEPDPRDWVPDEVGDDLDDFPDDADELAPSPLPTSGRLWHNPTSSPRENEPEEVFWESQPERLAFPWPMLVGGAAAVALAAGVIFWMAAGPDTPAPSAIPSAEVPGPTSTRKGRVHFDTSPQPRPTTSVSPSRQPKRSPDIVEPSTRSSPRPQASGTPPPVRPTQQSRRSEREDLATGGPELPPQEPEVGCGPGGLDPASGACGVQEPPAG